MKLLLIGPDLEENLSLAYLASSLEHAGHEGMMSSYNSKNDISRIIKESVKVDIIGLSITYQAKAKEYLHLAALLKKKHPGKKIIAGGHYASCRAKELLLHHNEIDLIVIEEGEETLVEVSNNYSLPENNLEAIKGIAFRKDGDIVFTDARPKIEDLDSLPTPKRNRKKPYMLAGVPTAYILGSRGCLNTCAYCCITTMHSLAPGKRLRQRSPENIVKEMAHLYLEMGIRHFVFHDDNFLVHSREKNLERLKALSDAIADKELQDIGMTIKCCPSDINEEVLTKLREIGVARMFLGIESSKQETLATLNRKQNIAEAEHAMSLCKDFGISVQFNIMIFNPDTSFDTIYSDIEFMQKYVSYPLNFCRTELFAGTPLERTMIDSGRAKGDYLSMTYRFNSPVLDRLSYVFTRMFYKRCWAKSSLMLLSVSLEHYAALLMHHYKKSEIKFLVEKTTAFRRAVNNDSLSLLKELTDLFKREKDNESKFFIEQIKDLIKREKVTLKQFLHAGKKLQTEINSFCFTTLGIEFTENNRLITHQPKRKSPAKHAAAAILALSVSGISSCGIWGVSEYAPPPLIDRDKDGLFDKYERDIFLTDPELIDTDDDGIPDGDEDHDNDGMSNLEYQDKYLSSY